MQILAEKVFSAVHRTSSWLAQIQAKTDEDVSAHQHRWEIVALARCAAVYNFLLGIIGRAHVINISSYPLLSLPP